MGKHGTRVMYTYEDDYGQVIYNVHSQNDCRGEFCTIHRHSEHAKSIGKQSWRNDRGIMERICEHGVGHPDPDDPLLDDDDGTHGCDGCCA